MEILSSIKTNAANQNLVEKSTKFKMSQMWSPQQLRRESDRAKTINNLTLEIYRQKMRKKFNA